MLRVATDIGGTFTDLVYVTSDGKVGTAKSHTTPGNFEQGVLDTFTASRVSPAEFASFVHGTTIVINAITERKGAKTALITTLKASATSSRSAAATARISSTWNTAKPKFPSSTALPAARAARVACLTTRAPRLTAAGPFRRLPAILADFPR